MTGRILAVTVLVLAGLGGRAHADGTVLQIDGDDIYVDVGVRDGAGPGTKLTLLHVIVARDPVSGKALRDRFPLGQLEVSKCGERVCVARAPDALRARVRVGDEVALASQPRVFTDPWQEAIDTRRAERQAQGQPQPARVERTGEARAAERQAAVKRAEAAIAAAEVARATWQRTLGKPPEDRVGIWEAYLDATPSSPYATAIKQEIASLRAQMEAEERVAQQMTDPDSRRAEMRVERLALLERDLGLTGPLVVRAPSRVYEGSPVELAFTVLQPGDVERAWLYYRHRGQDSFQRVELGRDGDAYLRGVIPAAVVHPPGLQYFVEILGDGEAGAPRPVLGSQQSPYSIGVEPAVEERVRDRSNRSRVTMFMDYVDFDGNLGGGFDQYLYAEVDFMYRFIEPIYAMRVGFGTLGGVGGPKDWIDMHPDDCGASIGQYRCRRVSYSFAYLEFEYRLSRSIAVMARPQFGTGTSDSRSDTTTGRCYTDDIQQCTFFSAFGLRGRVRIGDERATNLTLDVGFTNGVGTLFEAAYTWHVIPHFPVKLAAQVTDQPVPEDLGVRLIADVGWRSLSWMYPSLRVAYQARDVDHAGLSGGVAVNFDW